MILILFVPIIAFSQLEQPKWDYPVKPGSEEWRLTSYAEKLALNQLPNDLIKSITTGELLDYCMKYPFNKVILLFNNPNAGFEKVFSESLCWQEFLNRPDAIETFLKLYDKKSTENIENIAIKDEKRNEMFNEFFLEKFVSETELANKADLKMQKLLLKSLIDKHNEKKERITQYRGFSYWSVVSAILTILKYEDVITADLLETADYKSLKERGICYNPEVEATIVSLATKRLEK